MLNEEQKSFYEERGYLIVDNIVSENDLKLIKVSINNMLDAIIVRAKKEYPKYQNILENADNI